MRFLVVQRILGLLLTVFSLTMLPPALLALASGDGGHVAFLESFGIILGLGLALWLPVYNRRYDLRLRDGFIIVVLFWGVLGLTGAIPFLLFDELQMGLADAVFESVSGLTTTGATVITGLDALPGSLLFYRHELQWLGGIGIIVLAVAILPMLGIGGMQLYRAETPGPMKDNKLTPRITETAKALWYIYLGLTSACGFAYYLAGMSVFDAVCHAFSTVAIGGFSTHDASIGWFDNPLIEAIAVLFMFLAGVNFSLHFLALRYRNAKPYLFDSEFRFYSLNLLGICLVVSAALLLTGTYHEPASAIRHGVFQAVSVATTTGFATTAFAYWPTFVPVLLLFSSFIGGCAGSTGGGIKVMRIQLLFKQGVREIRRLVHPSAVISIKVGDKPIPDRIVDAVWGFFAAYVASFALLMLMLLAMGIDQVTAFSAVAASINNLGPGLGEVSASYAGLPAAAKYTLSFAMLLGRLEIFTLLVVMSPTFWRS